MCGLCKLIPRTLLLIRSGIDFTYIVSICNRSLNLSIMWTTPYLNRNGYPSEDEDMFIWFALWDLSWQSGRTRFDWTFLLVADDGSGDEIPPWYIICNYCRAMYPVATNCLQLEQLILLMRMGSFSSYHHHHHRHQWHWCTNKEDSDVFICPAISIHLNIRNVYTICIWK